ncbi:MAG TPA: class I SAM-dependent methyltransferase [Solirubrobacteraceae bacterium]|jgi:SAM-dependent methyltransferase
MTDYDTLALVYDWLVHPADLLVPQGSAEAFDGLVDLQAGARVLDCACGTGHLAVGLAQRGLEVVATDASAAMIDRTRTLAADHGAPLTAHVCAWENLAERDWSGSFDAVFCVGNSLVHAPGADARRRALTAMRDVLRAGGTVVVTSRNWEQVRAAGSQLEVAQQLVSRDGVLGLPIYAWSIAEDWDEPHHFDVAVALLAEDGTVTTHAERMAFWPFDHETLRADLRAAGLTPATTTYDDELPRYAVVARRAP